MTTTLLPADINQRLDRWIKKYHAKIPYPLIQKLFRKKAIKVNGKWAKPDYRLQEGDDVYIPELKDSARTVPVKKPSKKIDLISHVIYEDDDIVAINKPQGIAVQGGTGQDSHIDGSLEQFQINENDPPALVHRIDKDTTGLLLIARHHKAAENIIQQFKDKKIQKTYYAILLGKPPHKKGKVNVPLLKRGGENVKVQVDHKNGKDATSHYEVLSTIPGYTLVALSPITGRTHQLRVHMAHLGCPILGDGKYGGKLAQPKISTKRITMHLHARDLQLVLPNGKKKTLKAPLPSHFEETLVLLKLPMRNKR